MIASTVAILRHARLNGYAIPAINVFDDLSLRAAISAADALSAPLIIQASVKTARSIGVELFTKMFASAATATSVPVALHLDHCPDRAFASEVIKAGWSSILFDASDRDLPTATRETAEVVAEAHIAGVEVECEVENIVGVEDGVGSDESVHSYTSQQLIDMLEETGADMLAPHLGTAHGVYRSRPQLLPSRVRELVAKTDKPIVLHGGTGLTNDEFQEFISAGVSKINISTALKQTYMEAAAKHLVQAKERDHWDPPSMFRDTSKAVHDMVESYLKQFNADGRAKTSMGRV
jgi:ketose-bisphosphate aldolase